MNKDTLLETRNTLITGLNRQVEELRPIADQATRFEEELKEANNELAQTHKKVQRLENIVEKYKQKAEESNALLRQNEVPHIYSEVDVRFSRMKMRS
jgi:septal ring factor EnvC (AmiA/AmiB activator)